MARCISNGCLGVGYVKPRGISRSPFNFYFILFFYFLVLLLPHILSHFHSPLQYHSVSHSVTHTYLNTHTHVNGSIYTCAYTYIYREEFLYFFSLDLKSISLLYHQLFKLLFHYILFFLFRLNSISYIFHNIHQPPTDVIISVLFYWLQRTPCGLHHHSHSN